MPRSWRRVFYTLCSSSLPKLTINHVSPPQRPGVDEDGSSKTLDLLDALLRLWSILQCSLIHHLAYGSFVPSPEPATIARLRALIPSFSVSRPRWHAYCDEDRPIILDGFVRYYESLLVDGRPLETTPELREKWRGDHKRRWWTCEALVAEVVGKKDPCSTGTREDDREQMMACSRVSSCRSLLESL